VSEVFGLVRMTEGFGTVPVKFTVVPKQPTVFI
jgi:hypothetical protein